MCGRVFCTLSPQELILISKARNIGNLQNISTHYNICPTSCIPTIRGSKQNGKFERIIESMIWGAKTPFSFIINCRGEELFEKRYFRPLLNYNRCVFIFEGYYEWTPNKEPFAFFIKNIEEISKSMERKNVDDENKENYSQYKQYKPIFIAGLFSQYEEAMIVTVEADEKFNSVHHRVPVLLEEEEIDKWLNYDEYKFSQLSEMFIHTNKKVYKEIEIKKIAPYLNNPKCKSDVCLTSYEDYSASKKKSGIMKYFSPNEKQKSNLEENSPLKTYENKKEFAKYDKEDNSSQNYIEEIEFKQYSKKQIPKNEQSFDIMKEIENEIILSDSINDFKKKLKGRKENDICELVQIKKPREDRIQKSD